MKYRLRGTELKPTLLSWHFHLQLWSVSLIVPDVCHKERGGAQASPPLLSIDCLCEGNRSYYLTTGTTYVGSSTDAFFVPVAALESGKTR